MKHHLGRICLALFSSALLAMPAHAGRPGRTPPSAGRGFSGGSASAFSRSPPSAGRSVFPSTRTGEWGRDGSVQRRDLVRDRNQQHRLYRADQLRGISERNGNARLGETATRMEQRAVGQPVPREQAPQNAYRHIRIPPREEVVQNTSAPPPPPRKPSWSERVRSWLPW